MRFFTNNVIFQKKELRQFCTYRLIFGIAYSFMIPIIPLFLDNIGITTVMIGTIMSLYGVSKTIAQIPFGHITDKVGDKRVLILALIFMIAVPFSYTLTKDKNISGSIYIIQGAILGMAAPATYSILSRSVDVKRRGESTGYAACVFTLGGGIGAAIASFLLEVTNSYNIIFYLSSAGVALTAIYVIFKIPKTSKAAIAKCTTKKVTSKNNIQKEIKRCNLMPKIILLCAVAFLGDYIYGCVVALFHFYGKDVLGATTSYTSTIISVYLLVFGIGAPIAGWVSDKVGNKRQLFLSFIVMDLTLLGLSITKSIPIFTIIIVIYFLGATFLNASLQSVLSQFGENPRIKGRVFGIVGASESLGYALSPIVSAYVYEINKSYLFISLLAVSVLVTGTYLLLYKKSDIK